MVAELCLLAFFVIYVSCLIVLVGKSKEPLAWCVIVRYHLWFTIVEVDRLV